MALYSTGTIEFSFFACGASMWMRCRQRSSRKKVKTMGTKLYWAEGPWTGKLALAARPRGGDWLEDDLSEWLRAGIATVISLLTPEEEQELDLTREAREVRAQGMQFLSLPIADRQVPISVTEVAGALEKLDANLASGKNVVIHCRQGIGRTGLVAACLLVTKGLNPEAAVQRLSAARGSPVPETAEQRRWIDDYAAILAGTK